jgi:nucleoprotein TPR
LLKNVARLENGALPSDEDLEETPIKPAENIEDVITDNLVLFGSIGQLQEQNQKLLKIVRELGAKMEAEEREYRDAMEKEQGEAVREAHEAIQELSAELERQKKSSEITIQAYVKERDTLRSMLARSERGGAVAVAQKMPATEEAIVNRDPSRLAGDTQLARELEDTKKQFAAYRSEMGFDSERVREDLIESRREVGKLSAALAKANAKVEYLTGTLSFFDDVDPCHLQCKFNSYRPPSDDSRAAHSAITGERKFDETQPEPV